MRTAQTLPKRPISIAKAVIPLISLCILVFIWQYHMRWAIAPVVLSILLFYFGFHFVLPRLVRGRISAFNTKALKLLTSGQAAEVQKLVKRSTALRILGRRGPLDAKLGLAYIQCGLFDKAIRCFDAAIRVVPLSEQTALRVGLVKALFVTGNLARAETEGRAILDQVTWLPEVLTMVARARVGQGKLGDDTRKMLDNACLHAPSADVSLMIALTRIELACAAGRKAGEVPEGADSSQPFLRAWIHLVRGLLRRQKGDLEKAQQSFRKAIDLMPASFVSAAATLYLNAPPDAHDKNPVGEKDKAPAIRRKKKRRR